MASSPGGVLRGMHGNNGQQSQLDSSRLTMRCSARPAGFASILGRFIHIFKNFSLTEWRHPRPSLRPQQAIRLRRQVVCAPLFFWLLSHMECFFPDSREFSPHDFCSSVQDTHAKAAAPRGRNLKQHHTF